MATSWMSSVRAATTGANISLSGLGTIDGVALAASTGLRAGVEGQVVTLVNLTGQAMTLAHQSSSSSTNNRILSSTGADVTLTPAGTGFSSATLRYSTSQHRWLYSA